MLNQRGRPLKVTISQSEVAELISGGLTVNQISKIAQCNPSILYRRYRDAIRLGRASKYSRINNLLQKGA